VVDKVQRFLEGLRDAVRGNEPELLKKIASGDWSEQTENAVDKAVEQYAEDFGFDLDEEGHPLDEGEEDERPRAESQPSGQETERSEEGVPA
jgi:F-type H+-transporting ATPase subunit alpha